ncbi:hypothetical protein BRC88_13750 [Halobacteriales archaeon QS_4_69_225]|nr:MAG: hypothetical protein BRC88_13750 [Halobacteriales archaeon QS_4_69_225]
MSRLVKTVHEIALVCVVFEVTGSSILISLIILANIIPNMLAAVPAGVIVDRVNQKFLIVGTEFASALAVLSIPLVGRSHFLVPTVLGVAVILDLLGAVFVPARQALAPDVVPESELDAANSLSRMTISTTQIFYIVGGLVVGLLVHSRLSISTRSCTLFRRWSFSQCRPKRAGSTTVATTRDSTPQSFCKKSDKLSSLSELTRHFRGRYS